MDANLLSQFCQLKALHTPGHLVTHSEMTDQQVGTTSGIRVLTDRRVAQGFAQPALYWKYQALP